MIFLQISFLKVFSVVKHTHFTYLNVCVTDNLYHEQLMIAVFVKLFSSNDWLLLLTSTITAPASVMRP